MITFTVNTKSKKYPIFIGKGVLQNIGKIQKKRLPNVKRKKFVNNPKSGLRKL